MSDLRQYDEGHSDYLKRRLGVKKLPKTAHQEKAIKGKVQHTPMSQEISQQRKIYRENLKQSHINHLHGKY